MTQDELDEIIAAAPEYRDNIEKQLIENEKPDQALEYHAVALAYPWDSLSHPDHHPRDSNESHIPFIYYGLLKHRMTELKYEYEETNHHSLFERRFIFNRMKG